MLSEKPSIENKKYLSETIGVLRFPLMVCVVLIHTIIPNQTQHLFVDWFDSYVIESFVRIAVPLFFFISGFLFFNGVDRFGRSEYWDKLKKRVKRLLVPYILCGVFAIFVKYVFFLLGEDDSVYLFDNYYKWIYYVLWDPINYQLWFVRDLFLVVLISPLIYFLLKRLKFVFVLLLGGAWLLWHKNIFALFDLEYIIITGNIFGVLGFDFVSLFFFSFGAWFALFNKNFASEFKRLFPGTIVLYLGCTIGKFVCNDGYFAEIFNRLAIVFGLISAVAIVYMFVKRGKVKRSMFLEQGSQFIYYYHVLFLICYFKVLFHLHLFEVESTFVYFGVYISCPIITILLGLWLYKIGMRYMPRVMNFVLGLK